MKAIKKIKGKASDILHKLEPAKYTIAVPLAITGIYATMSALTGVDYSQNTANGLASISFVSAGALDTARYYKYRR